MDTLFKPKAMSNNGLTLYKKDTIILVGDEPNHPVVSYVDSMLLMLNNKKEYTISKINRHDNNKFSISAGGWAWDCRNIIKIIDDTEIIIADPEIFNPENLDI